MYNKWKQGYVLEQQEHPRDYTWSQKKMYYHILKERLHQEYVKKQDHKLIEMKQNDYQKVVQDKIVQMVAQDKKVVQDKIVERHVEFHYQNKCDWIR